MSRAQSVEIRNENMESVVEVGGILQTFLHLAKSTQDQGDLTGAAPGSTVVSQTY